MISPLQLEDNAPWRQRFRCNSLGYVYVAPKNAPRGIIHASLEGPTKRIFAWGIPSDDLRPLLQEDETPSYSWLGPAGDYLYYLKDDRGSELGHIVRVPFSGGPAEDLTPELLPYTLRGFDISRGDACLAFGRDFQEKINGDVGRWELEDMLAARSWLIGEGIADPNSILLAGGSYGDFLTVRTLSEEPEL